ncbi:S-layer homology domain-containing protein [Paenibacillus sp. D2_2]|uniref:S-layer homology domain-containing protein n=1 Tax=Paenibacillus sp. D2_2 TaxID=3073092 RepID=UPI0028152420|nr:S-layer homology domain-containing protein [Paenibacillus sp. D2_2]WMT40678.1 S-layer homology domain-containing protein [Paenibacillus sp. D2_2]
MTEADTTTTPGSSGQPSYLSFWSSNDFGLSGYGLALNTAQTSVDRSRYGQMITKYTLDSAKLKESLGFIGSTPGTQKLLVFEVPSTEKAAEVAVPLNPLMDLYSSGKIASLAIRYGDVLYELPIEKIPFTDISRLVSTNSFASVSLTIRMESVPKVQLPALSSNGAITISALGDPVEVYINANVAGTTTSAEVAHKGKIYIYTTKQVPASTASLIKYDMGSGVAAYTPSKASTRGAGVVFTGVVGGNTVIGPAVGYSYFDDINKHWAKNEIAELASKLIVEPRSKNSTKFEPDKNITRAEFAVFIVKGLGLDGDESSARRFPDVVPGSATGAYIGAAAKAGIINGNSDGTFKPNSNITREQMALMMVRAMEYSGYDLSNSSGTQILVKFKDGAKIQNKVTVAKAVQEGIIQGMTQTTFQPQGYATRGQAVVMLKRVLDKLN